MNTIASKIAGLTGWRRIVAALVLGTVASGALPPLGLWPLLFVTMPALVWLLDGICDRSSNRRQRAMAAFMTGWAFGTGYFAASLYWVGEAFLVDAELFAWLMPFAITIGPAGLALCWGGAAAVAVMGWTTGIGRVFVFAASLAGFEWLRGHLLTGFPWNAPAYATDALLPLAQSAGLLGLYGVCFLVVLWSAAPAVIADEPDRAAEPVFRYAGHSIVILSLIAALTYGTWRLGTTSVADHDGMYLRIVQPNIAQKDKWVPANRDRIYARYLALTRRPVTAPQSITHVIWPESALPVLVDENPAARRQIVQTSDGTAVTILGGLRRSLPTSPAQHAAVFNSVLVLDPAGDVAARYDKQRLVPFGEYLPLAQLLEPLGVRQLVALPGGFGAGPGPQTVRIPGTPSFAPLICYEAIFPHDLIDRKERPQWLLNVTNDAWFGKSAGPHQHLAQARMRAIEEGLPLVRAANTGISALIDPMGRIKHRLELGQQGVIDTPLPAPLPPTFYADFGDVTFFCIIVLIGLGPMRRLLGI